MGGDFTEIVCKHPLGTFRFQGKSNEDATMDHGGYRANDDSNAITGGGKAIYQITRNRWSMELPVAADFDSENETKTWEQLAAHPEDGIWTFTHVAGWTRKGKGRPVGDQQFSSLNAQGTLKVSGGGKFEKI